ATIARIAKSEDPHTRLMQVELDVKNAETGGKLVQGMYGRVTIVLDRAAKSLSVPSGCVRNKQADGRAEVFVVRKGRNGSERAKLVQVRVGMDDGLKVEVLQGLTTADRVVLQPPPDLADGAPVVLVENDHDSEH